ncbi:amino acid ABC transporter permease [Streptomyces cinerochromogenes]|uniref:amino acid ABC transporter permease n=1 Tax=Streptomyces cinerochromogenes TaxID=66422 RepID=UPI0033B5CCA9
MSPVNSAVVWIGCGNQNTAESEQGCGWPSIRRVWTFVWILYLLFDTGQFTHTKWMPFEYRGVQELLLRGLGNTLKAFAVAAVLSLALGGLPATGRLSDHRPVRLLATLVVEFFEVLRSGVNAVERGQREAAFALGMRKTRVMAHVLVPQAVRAMLPALIGQLVVALKDTSLGFLITYEEFLHAGKLIASDLDYDLPFIPVVMVIAPICIGMCMLLSWFADWVSRRERRSPKTKGVAVATPGPGALLPGGVPPTAPRA